MTGSDHTPMIDKMITLGALPISALAIFNSLEKLAVTQWFSKNVLAGIKVLGVLGETAPALNCGLR